MLDIVYLNGEFTPLQDAKISVMDRGFLFGDAVYEAFPVYNQQLFAVDAHLKRLENSFAQARIDNPFSQSEWIDLFNTLLSKNQVTDAAIYCQISRGVQNTRAHYPNTPLKPTVFIACLACKQKTMDELKQGVTAITLPDPRWQHCDIKSTSLMANILALYQAKELGSEAVIFHRNGFITEECMRNVFIVKGNMIKTPIQDEKILPGITRQTLIDLAQANNIRVEETQFTEAALLDADEVFFTSSIKEIVPVLQINAQPIGKGKPGPMWETLIQLYHQDIECTHD